MLVSYRLKKSIKNKKPGRTLVIYQYAHGTVQLSKYQWGYIKKKLGYKQTNKRKAYT